MLLSADRHVAARESPAGGVQPAGRLSTALAGEKIFRDRSLRGRCAQFGGDAPRARNRIAGDSMTSDLEQVDEQTHITELTIAPDGRVYVFGMSRQIMEILEL